jgi:hypothetical protein
MPHVGGTSEPADAGARIGTILADEIWMEDFRGNGASCIMAAFVGSPVEDPWKPFLVALGDGNPNYRGGITATAEMHFVGMIKGRMIFASSRVLAPADPGAIVAGEVLQLVNRGK